MCRCHFLPVKCATCVELGLTGMLGVRVGPKVLVVEGHVASQHGSGLEGSSHPCTKGYKAIFCHTCAAISLYVCVVNMFLCYSYFSPKQVKINHMMEVQNMRLFLGP